MYERKMPNGWIHMRANYLGAPPPFVHYKPPIRTLGRNVAAQLYNGPHRLPPSLINSPARLDWVCDEEASMIPTVVKRTANLW